jgi:hypothetical protein
MQMSMDKRPTPKKLKPLPSQFGDRQRRTQSPMTTDTDSNPSFTGPLMSHQQSERSTNESPQHQKQKQKYFQEEDLDLVLPSKLLGQDKPALSISNPGAAFSGSDRVRFFFV